MTPQEKIEEAHGIWELAIVRLGALAEGEAPKRIILDAVREEREAWKVWKKASDAAVLA